MKNENNCGDCSRKLLNIKKENVPLENISSKAVALDWRISPGRLTLSFTFTQYLVYSVLLLLDLPQIGDI